MVREYDDVFPDELAGLPPPSEVEFQIDHIPDVTLKAKTSFRLASLELKEMLSQPRG